MIKANFRQVPLDKDRVKPEYNIHSNSWPLLIGGRCSEEAFLVVIGSVLTVHNSIVFCKDCLGRLPIEVHR